MDHVPSNNNKKFGSQDPATIYFGGKNGFFIRKFGKKIVLEINKKVKEIRFKKTKGVEERSLNKIIQLRRL